MTAPRRGGRATALLGVLLLTVGVGGCSGSGSDEVASSEPATPAAVALAPSDAPRDISIGVVVSLGSDPGQGSQWSAAAEAAEVAAYRFGMGDVDVRIVPENDGGTSTGATKAVDTLVDDGVSGIVLATAGSHLTAALDAASEAGVPALLPYDTSIADLPQQTWRTGPSREQVASALADGLESSGATSPFLVDAGGGGLPGLSPAAAAPFGPGGDPARLARRVDRERRGAAGVDSVVVSGPVELQARVVTALQARDVDLPVFLTGDALSPAFGPALAEAGGSLAAPLTSAGVVTDDVVALEQGERGSAVSAYLAGVRAAAQDAEVTDFFDDRPFGDVARTVDARSHDAVVALVAAATEAGSPDPADVAEALGSMTLDHGDGLAGPALDFRQSQAVAAPSVVPLQATTQDPGLRPVTGTTQTPRLYWFQLPAG